MRARQSCDAEIRRFTSPLQSANLLPDGAAGQPEAGWIAPRSERCRLVDRILGRWMDRE